MYSRSVWLIAIYRPFPANFLMFPEMDQNFSVQLANSEVTLIPTSCPYRLKPVLNDVYTAPPSVQRLRHLNNGDQENEKSLHLFFTIARNVKKCTRKKIVL